MGQNRKIIRILIVDDHPLVREGLRLRIENESNMSVCGEIDNVDRAARAAASMKPDLVIVDLSLREGNGIDLIKRITGDCPKTRILVCSMHGDTDHATRSIAAGATGYVHKRESPERVIEAIHDVMDGQIYLCPNTTRQLVKPGDTGPGGGEDEKVAELTDRELEVLKLIGHGRSTGQIATELGLSVNTIDTHRRKLRKKLGFDSGPELVRFAVQWVLENS
jgi:DNA-binding NarL/FixJ family response regulator